MKMFRFFCVIIMRFIFSSVAVMKITVVRFKVENVLWGEI